MFVVVTYWRCPASVHSYNFFCYVILNASVAMDRVTDLCAGFAGMPVWYSDDAEINWLRTVLAAHSIDCIYIGDIQIIFLYFHPQIDNINDNIVLANFH